MTITTFQKCMNQKILFFLTAHYTVIFSPHFYLSRCLWGCSLAPKLLSLLILKFKIVLNKFTNPQAKIVTFSLVGLSLCLKNLHYVGRSFKLLWIICCTDILEILTVNCSLADTYLVNLQGNFQLIPDILNKSWNLCYDFELLLSLLSLTPLLVFLNFSAKYVIICWLVIFFSFEQMSLILLQNSQ